MYLKEQLGTKILLSDIYFLLYFQNFKNFEHIFCLKVKIFWINVVTHLETYILKIYCLGDCQCKGDKEENIKKDVKEKDEKTTVKEKEGQPPPPPPAKSSPDKSSLQKIQKLKADIQAGMLLPKICIEVL